MRSAQCTTYWYFTYRYVPVWVPVPVQAKGGAWVVCACMYSCTVSFDDVISPSSTWKCDRPQTQHTTHLSEDMSTAKSRHLSHLYGNAKTARGGGTCTCRGERRFRCCVEGRWADRRWIWSFGISYYLAYEVVLVGENSARTNSLHCVLENHHQSK